jgi:hypothetical protein
MHKVITTYYRYKSKMQLRSGRSLVKSSSSAAPASVTLRRPATVTASVTLRRPATVSAPVRSSSSARVLHPMKLRSGRRLGSPAITPAPASFYHDDVNSIEFIRRKKEISAMIKQRLDVFHAVKAKHHKPGSPIQSRIYYVECARAVIELYGLMNEYFDEIDYYIFRRGESGKRFLKITKDKAYELEFDTLGCTSKHRFRGGDSKLLYNTADELAAFTNKIGKLNRDINK